MTPSFPTQFATALRAFFAQHLPLTRGLSPRTVLSYRDTFVLLLRFLAKRHGCAVVDLELQHFRADDVLAFLEHLETERKNSVATRNARLAAVHSFARFLATRDPEQVAEAQRLLAVPIKRGPARAIDYLEGQEIGALMEAVVFHARDHLRDRALLLTLFNTGARVQEVLDIRTGDLQLERPTFVRLRGKGRKERLCPLWPETVTALQALLSATPGPNTVPIFRNHRGDPMTRFGVRYLLRCYAQQAQTAAPTLSAKRVHPHTCRWCRSGHHQPLARARQHRNDEPICSYRPRNQTQSLGTGRASSDYCRLFNNYVAHGCLGVRVARSSLSTS
jgi:site-specific recombinase XerD